MGKNELIPLNGVLISNRMMAKLKNIEKGKIPPFWDGFATERTLATINNQL